jgi:thiamine transport system permease protein
MTAVPVPDAAAAERRGIPAGWRIVAFVVPGAFFAVLFVWPVGTIIGTGLTGEGAAGGILDVVTSGRIAGILWFSTWQAVASTVLTLLVGLPGAWLVARVDFPGRTLVRAAVTAPFVLPTVVVASAFTSLLGPGSPVMAWVADLTGMARPPDLTGTIWAVLAAHVFFNVAVVVRTVGSRWANLDSQLGAAAQTLGATPWQAFRRVTLPLLRPAITAAAVIVFLFTFTSFGIVLILGSPGMATLEVAIYRATAQLLDLPQAAALAILQLVVVVASLLATAHFAGAGTGARPRGRRGDRSRSDDGSGGRQRGGAPAGGGAATAAAAPRRPARPTTWAGVVAVLVLLFVVIGLPIAILVERSLAVGDGHSLRWYRELSDVVGVMAVSPWEAVRNSMVFAVAATVVATLVGGAAAVAITARRGRLGRVFDLLLMLPLGVSAVTVGFGFLITLDTPPLDLRSSPVLVPLAQALVAIPFVVRILVPSLRAVDDRLRQAAAVLGANPSRVWRHVDLPILFRSATVAAGFAFAISLGEFGATVFLARAGTPTLPVAIYRFLGQPGAANLGRAMAMSCVLMVVTIVVVAVVDRLRIADLGAF